MSINYTDKLATIKLWSDLYNRKYQIKRIYGVQRLTPKDKNDAVYDIGNDINNSINDENSGIYDSVKLFLDLQSAHDNNGIYEGHGLNIQIKGEPGEDGEDGSIQPYNIIYVCEGNLIPSPSVIDLLKDALGNLVEYDWRHDTTESLDTCKAFTGSTSNQQSYAEIFSYFGYRGPGSPESIHRDIYGWLHGYWWHLSKNIKNNIKISSGKSLMAKFDSDSSTEDGFIKVP